MSTFRVDLTQGNQSLNCASTIRGDGGSVNGHVCDPAIDNSGNTIQRTIEVTGPNLTRRILSDGETFEDCNYWKRFAYPQVDRDQAFIVVVSDDGSVYSDIPSENTFAKVANFTVDPGDTYTDNAYDVVSTHGGPAVFTQITTDEAIKVRLNGDSSAIIDVAAGTQVFDNGDLIITEIAFDNTASGASSATVQVLFSIKSQCNS